MPSRHLTVTAIVECCFIDNFYTARKAESDRLKQLWEDRISDDKKDQENAYTGASMVQFHSVISSSNNLLFRDTIKKKLDSFALSFENDFAAQNFSFPQKSLTLPKLTKLKFKDCNTFLVD